MKILVDMNLSPDWVELLQQAHIDAVHWRSLGQGDVEDELIFDYATEHGLVVLTRDLGFSKMLVDQQGSTTSLVQVRSGRAGTELIGEAVLEALLKWRTELEAGALVTVDVKHTRIRVLPFPSED